MSSARIGQQILDPAARVDAQNRLRAVQWVGVLLFFAVTTAILTYPQLLDLNGTTGAHHDTLFSAWRLAWIADRIITAPLRLFDANIFYPERRTLAYSDALVLPGLLAAPLRWIGLPPILVYNLLFLSSFVLSAAAMFFLVRSLTGEARAALVAGLVFAYAPFRFEHYDHLELQTHWWMPLGLWALHHAIVTGAWTSGVLLGVLVGLQVLSSIYCGIFFATSLLIVAPVLLFGVSSDWSAPAALWPWMRRVRALAAGVAVAGVMLVPYASPYLANRRTVGERPIEEIRRYSATPEDYLGVPDGNRLYGQLLARHGAPERRLFPGATALLTAAVALWPPISAVRAAYALGLAFAVDGSLGLNGLTYPWLHAYVPPYRGFRVPARFGAVVLLMLAALAGFGTARLLRAIPGSRRRTMVAVGLVAALVLEYRTDRVLRPVGSPPQVYEWLRQQPPSVVLELPVAPAGRLSETNDAIYMYFSTFHWQMLVNGYSGYYPPSYIELLDAVRTFPDSQSIHYLQRRGIRYVILHARLYGEGEYARVTRALLHRQDIRWIALFGSGSRPEVAVLEIAAFDRTAS